NTGSFDWRVLVAEAVGALVFTFAFAAAVYQRYEGGKAAALIGGGLFMGIIIASVASNAILNPAVALGNQSWARAYIFGPIIGGVIGTNLYVLLFAPSKALVARSSTDAGVTAPAVSARSKTAATASKA